MNVSFFPIELTPKCDRNSIRAFPLTKPTGPAAPIDPFELVISTRPYELMTAQEVLNVPAGAAWIVDLEIYINYLLISFKHIHSGKVVVMEKDDFYSNDPRDMGRVDFDRYQLLYMMENFLTIGYNSKPFDLPIIQMALLGASCAQLKDMANVITSHDGKPLNIEEKFGLSNPGWNHIDLYPVMPLKGSLKLYAGRLHCKRMQDLPFEHDAYIEIADREKLKLYNINDLDNTELLLTEVTPQLMLRYSMSEEYGVDLRSRSDAQIAESVLKNELERIKKQRIRYPKIDVGTEYSYNTPSFIRYETPVFQNMLQVVQSARYVVNEKGSIKLPDEIKKLDLRLGQCRYRMGIGGLHSSEETIAHIADESTLLIDRDVVSFYPRIIINTELFPHHLGRDFLTVYETIVNRRVYAKEIKDQVSADSLKITVNGSFGKLGNKYSALYSPDRIMHVCITGQLSLLMLIEMLELRNIPVVSANTDGVLIKCSKFYETALAEVVAEWENRTGFATEEGRYKAIYSRDVNNYIGVKKDNTIGKLKGAFAEKGSSGNTELAKNPTNLICVDAVCALLTKGIPIEETIRSCSDIRRFLTVRNVKGGAIKSGVLLGRVIRWYFSVNCLGEINYVESGNKVPMTDGAMPLMELSDVLPPDINYDRYIEIANGILVDIGHTPGLVKDDGKLFYSTTPDEFIVAA